MVPSSNGSPPGVPAVPNPCRGRRETGFWLLLAWQLFAMSKRPDSGSPPVASRYSTAATFLPSIEPDSSR